MGDMMNHDEIWKPVAGYEGLYEVSDQGRVRTIGRTVNRFYKRTKRFRPTNYKSKLIYIGKNPVNGYLACVLHRKRKGRGFSIHRLVMTSFIGPRPEGYEVGHRNGNKMDNRLENLRYITPLENSAEKHLHGTMARGERQGHAKLTEAQVQDIKTTLNGRTHGYQPLARKYGVNWVTIADIAKGRSWAWLK